MQGLTLGGAPASNAPLGTLCQIGDVILVHDESAVANEPLDAEAGFVNLVGCSVVSFEGRSLGKVRWSITFTLCLHTFGGEKKYQNPHNPQDCRPQSLGTRWLV